MLSLLKGAPGCSLASDPGGKYIDIFKLLDINPRTSKRFKNIRKHFERDTILHRELKTIGGDRMNIPIDLTNKNPVQIFLELSLLLAAKQAGNKNTLGKASIISDHLKNHEVY